MSHIPGSAHGGVRFIANGMHMGSMCVTQVNFQEASTLMLLVWGKLNNLMDCDRLILFTLAVWPMKYAHNAFVHCFLFFKGNWLSKTTAKNTTMTKCCVSLQWRHDGRNSVSNHQPHHSLLNRLFRRRSKKTSKLRVTGLCVGNSPVPGEFPRTNGQ